MKSEQTLRPFEEYVRESIKTPRDAAAYLNAAAEDEDGRVFLMALKNVIDVHSGLSELARKTKLNRGNLHRILAGKGNPGFANIQKVLNASGFEFAIRPKKTHNATA